MSSIKDKIAKDRAKVLHKNGDAPSLLNQEPGRDGPKQTSNDDELKDAKIKAKAKKAKAYTSDFDMSAIESYLTSSNLPKNESLPYGQSTKHSQSQAEKKDEGNNFFKKKE